MAANAGRGSRSRHAELFTDGTCCCFLDLAVSRHGRTLTIGRVAIDAMTATFTIEDASMALEMPDQIAPLHYVATSTDNVSQIASLGASFAACSRYDCKSSATAS